MYCIWACWDIDGEQEAEVGQTKAREIDSSPRLGTWQLNTLYSKGLEKLVLDQGQYSFWGSNPVNVQ